MGFFHLANIASGIRSKSETCSDFPNLLAHSVSLCRRVRYARLRSSSVAYWQKLFDQIDDTVDIIFSTLILTTWGSKKTLERLAGRIDVLLEKLSPDNWRRLYSSVEESVSWTQQLSNRFILFDVKLLPDSLNVRTVTLLSFRSKNKKDFYSKYLNGYKGTDLQVLQYWQSVVIELLSEGKISWQSALEVISLSYMNGVISERYAFHSFVRKVSASSLPDDIAMKIASQPDCYPGFLVAAAEAKCRDIVASKIVKVGEIARRDRWFSTC